jgi:hypothetical protein
MKNCYFEKTINNFISTEIFGQVPSQILNALCTTQYNDWIDFHDTNKGNLYKQYFFVSCFLAEKLTVYGETGVWIFDTNVAIWGRNKTIEELKFEDDDIFYKIILGVKN